MKSPFPGMDPYLERHWGDVHTSLVTYARDQLRTQLPRELRVRVEEHVTIESDERRSGVYPDIHVVERTDLPAEQRFANHGLLLAEDEAEIVPIDEPATGRSLYIFDTTTGDRLVTAIEIISFANKSSSREPYLRKQADLRASGVNLVEIDLLRGGKYVLVAPPGRAPTSDPLARYFACVARAISPSLASVYSISLRKPLPKIHIPLRVEDEDALLDLQSLIEQAYGNAGYGDEIDYRRDPVPPLEPDDAAWADQMLREKGLR